MERATPAWCRVLMEFSLWAGVFTGVFLTGPLGLETARSTCAVFAGILTATWLLHGIFLRWFPYAFSWSSLAGIGLVAFLLVTGRDALGDHAMTLLIALPVFLAIPGAFTERQVARFLAFLCAAGGLQVLICLVSPTLFEKKSSLTASLAEGGALTGTLGTEAGLSAFLVGTVGVAAAFGLWSMARLAPDRSAATPGGRANSLAAPGTNLALLSVLTALLAMATLFLSVSLFPFATIVLTVVLFALLLLVKARLSIPAALVIVVLVVLAGAVNCARPAAGSGSSSTDVLRVNLETLAGGGAERSTPAGAAERLENPSQPLSAEGWRKTIDEGDWGALYRNHGPVALGLFMLFVLLLIIEGIVALFSADRTPPLLAAGALAGVLGLALVGLWGNFLTNPGIAILAAALCAMTAAGGEYDEEFEEIEVVA